MPTPPLQHTFAARGSDTPQSWLAGAREVLVFRALVLGDWLCATPALRALKAAAPRARLVLCGLPWTADLAARLPMVDEFVEFPGHPELPERRPAPGALPAFVQQMRARRFDLALQLHGSGGIVNPLVASFGARRTAGFSTPGTEAGLDLAVPWPEHGTEIARCLALTDALGAPRAGLNLAFPLIDADRDEAARLRAEAGIAPPYAIVHPGSQLPSRRWPAARFAQVADALAARGLTVVITGSAAEAPLAAAVRDAMAPAHPAPVDLTGRTSTLWTLGAMVEAAALVVANDTGISHIAAALRTPSSIVASGSDVARWAPLDGQRHPVHWHAAPCRPCAHAVCPTGHECALGVSASAVTDTALSLLASPQLETPCPRPTLPRPAVAFAS
jgi:ADP-heptose:LPS heptosyltransferase